MDNRQDCYEVRAYYEKYDVRKLLDLGEPDRRNINRK